jgi:bla regulator protein BlaR1
MNESDRMIETVLVENLEHQKSRTSFNAVWDDHSTQTGKTMKLKKSFVIAMIALFSSMLIFTGGYAVAKVFDKPVRSDNTDYPFVQDETIIGKWEVVDFVEKVEYFDAKSKSSETNLFLNALAFLSDGTMFQSIKGSPLTYSELVWTKDLVISKKDQTASKYMLQEIEGILYMFFEWKSGDYVFRNLEPGYYVLKQIDTRDYSKWLPPRREDDTEYPFEDDPQIHGEWETVDFVDKIGQFDPQGKKDDSINYLVGLNMEDNGKLTLITLSGALSSEYMIWTKGLILNKADKTASKYEIMELDGNTYLFYEWKSGDYIFRNREPSYYVLKKAD